MAGKFTLSLCKYKPTDTERSCTSLLGLQGRGFHGGLWQRPPEAWAAVQPPAPQARPRGARFPPGAQRQQPAGSPTGWHKHSRLQGLISPAPRSGPGRLSGSTAPQGALTTHQRAPRSRSHSSRGPCAEIGSPEPEPEPGGAEPRGGRTDRQTYGRKRE